MAYFFDESYYIAAKLAQMDSIGQPMTEDQLRAAIKNANLTVQEHYETYGRFEKLNPNPYFNEYEYLEAKARQLNSVGNQPNPEGGPWDAEAVLKAITDAGFTPAEHYEIYGAFERDAQGNFINPSNAFDANAYWSGKLLQLQTEEADRGWTMATMLEAFQEVGVSPVSHYQLWGADEANAGGIPFVQTVPVLQRVPNDPARDGVTGDVAPGNYLDATPPPTDGNAAPAHHPCDVGGLADTSVSPPPAHPDHSLPVPGDQDYLPPPSTIRPGPNVVILPPSGEGDTVSGHWLVVDRNTGKVIVVDRDGSILGQVDGTLADDGAGGQTITLPPSSNVPVSTLPPLDPDSLPDWIVPDPDLPNHFHEPTPPPPPPPPHSDISATVVGEMLTVSGDATGRVEVTLDASGAAVVTDGTMTVVVTGDANAGIHTVDVSGVTGHDVSLAPAPGAQDLQVTVTGQTGAGLTTTVNGGTGQDTISVTGGNVNVSTGRGDDTVRVGKGYGGTVDLGDGINTLEVSGEIGAATVSGHKNTLAPIASADVTAATLNDFTVISFPSVATLDTNSDLFKSVSSLSGVMGQDATLNIHMTATGGDLKLSSLTTLSSLNNVTINVIGTDDIDTVELGPLWQETTKLTVAGGKGDDTITLGKGRDTVIFEQNGMDNGHDAIDGFWVGDTKDVLDFFGTYTTKTDHFDPIFYIKDGNATAIGDYEAVRVITADGTLTKDQIMATSSQAGMLTVEDNTVAIALVADSTTATEFKVYEIMDMDSDINAVDYMVTLMGTVTIANAQAFDELVAANIA